MFKFDRDDREIILAALKDPDPENPIALALAERIADFTDNLAAQAGRNGKWPAELLLYKPETAFDDIVIRLTLQTIADELGHVITINWLPGKGDSTADSTW
jgi:hypothetical protein